MMRTIPPRPAYRATLLLLAIFVLLIAALAALQTGVTQDLDPTPWAAPALVTFPTPTPRSGWWQALPTPLPLHTPTLTP